MQLLFGQHVNDTKACNGTSVGIVLCFRNYSGTKMLKAKVCDEQCYKLKFSDARI